jgi:hypothetical protein
MTAGRRAVVEHTLGHGRALLVVARWWRAESVAARRGTSPRSITTPDAKRRGDAALEQRRS